MPFELTGQDNTVRDDGYWIPAQKHAGMTIYLGFMAFDLSIERVIEQLYAENVLPNE